MHCLSELGDVLNFTHLLFISFAYKGDALSIGGVCLFIFRTTKAERLRVVTVLV